MTQRQAEPHYGGYDSDHVITTICRYRDEHANTVAGFWCEGSDLILGVVGNATAHLDAIHQLLPGLEVKARSMTFSWAQLWSANQTIGRDMLALREEGLLVTAVGIAEGSNRVEVTLARDDPTWKDALTERYGGDILSFEFGIAVSMCERGWRVGLAVGFSRDVAYTDRRTGVDHRHHLHYSVVQKAVREAVKRSGIAKRITMAPMSLSHIVAKNPRIHRNIVASMESVSDFVATRSVIGNA